MNIHEFEIKVRTVNQKAIGSLSFIEYLEEIPFKVERSYWIYNVPKDVIRAGHAHKELNQILFCLSGNIEIRLDDGLERDSTVLEDASVGLLIKRGIWHHTIWRKERSVLLVIASDIYQEEDYISDHSDFLRYIRKGYWR